MNAALTLIGLVLFGAVWFLVPTDGPGALLICVAVSAPTMFLLFRSETDRTFLIRLFTMGLLVRIVLGTVINLGHMEDFFGGDAHTYDFFGNALNLSLHGNKYLGSLYQNFVSSGAGAWGMLYVVAGIYEVVGRNMLAVQFVNASIGSATGVVIYSVAQHLFENRRVSRAAAILACFFPSLILWSSQALKDALIVFSLSLSILMTLRLVERIKVMDAVFLGIGLIGLLSFRFYIFYMMVFAVVGAFLIGSKAMSAQSLLGRFILISMFGLAFTWFGVLRLANTQFERYGNLQALERSRADAAKSADSGFGKDVDVGTTTGALSAIPTGMLYLLFAPFPWQLVSLRQSITLPEMIIWWTSIPFLILGLWYAIKNKLRQITSVLLFTTMLTLVYSLFQGNVGTAYRQRSQLLVFYFIFVAVGFVLMLERRENVRRQQILAKQQVAEQMAERRRERLQTPPTPLEQS